MPRSECSIDTRLYAKPTYKSFTDQEEEGKSFQPDIQLKYKTFRSFLGEMRVCT